MYKDEKIVKLKLDIVFKRMFGNVKNEDVIKSFIADLLEIPLESIRRIYINNVELAPEYLNQKFSRLDLKLDVDGKTVNIEMQVNREPDFKERTLFYWSKLYSEELKEGDEYAELKQTICINIINFNIFDCTDYHSHFKITEKDRHEVLSEKFGIHFFELKKVKNAKKNKPMEDWLNLIDAETEGDLMAIQQTTVNPEVKKAIVMLKQLSADEQLRQEAYYREKRLHDEASALGYARREGIAEGMVKGIAQGKAEGRAEGRAEERALLEKKMRESGLSDAQIALILGE